ncbi:MAG: hypothetical protein Unbinned664contig1000_22 [Prokaryotic dsDNA virus sp.]|nr:MAG: hypothetical protein Unbinned664contig1000_22 [Prokaryotic dsDNA virus sp.]|tara:strand:- start:21372 stop:22046 length:675 start_codon:yes stop_codon:yes gene_type:complete
MSTDPEIITVVERINAVWRYPMSKFSILEYEERLNGLDSVALNKAIDELASTEDDRPSINRIKVAYDRYRTDRKEQPVRREHPYDMARALVNRQRSHIIASSKALFDQIPTDTGKGALRAYLYAAAWVMAQGVISAQTSQRFHMTSDLIATGYMTWTAPGEDLREARNLFRRGASLGRIEIEVPGRAMDWFRSMKDEVASKSIKRVPVEEFEKEQQFSHQGAVA